MARPAGGEHRQRLRPTGAARVRGIRQGDPCPGGFGAPDTPPPTPQPSGLSSTVHTQLEPAPPPDPESGRQARPPLQLPEHLGVTPNVPALRKRQTPQRTPGGGHPPGRAPPRTGPTKPNSSSSHGKRRVPKGEPAPDPISASSAGSPQRSVAPAAGRSITTPQPRRAPELAGARARARPETNTRSPLTQLSPCPSSLPASRSLPLT